MHSIKTFFFGLVLAIAMTACGGSESAPAAEEAAAPATEQPAAQPDAAAAAHGDSAEFTAAYVCPMHCEGSGSDQAGKCPKCGMDYVAQADHAADGHSHHENHQH